jgi:double-stranded uracil-DNA glycosylase
MTSTTRIRSRRPTLSSRRSGPVADVIAPDLDALFVGINPGFASARAGHHFANPANPFWRLLHESGFIARPLGPSQERELLETRLGITNLVARETAGVADLTRRDIDVGREALVTKIRQHRPRAVVFVGLTAYSAFNRRKVRRPAPRDLSDASDAPVTPAVVAEPTPGRGRVVCGEQPDRFAGARVFVVPNPSGRNAHFTYAEMLAAFRDVARALGRA